jgi:hypothetical protein
MSRGNIVDMTPSLTAGSVTFALRTGESVTYWYSLDDFASIVAGSDPADFEPIDEPALDDEGIAGATDIADIADAAELL